MKHKRRGIALIFNHINFKKMHSRAGGEIDSKELAQTLHYLGFDVRVYIDPPLKTISSTLKNGEYTARLRKSLEKKEELRLSRSFSLLSYRASFRETNERRFYARLCSNYYFKLDESTSENNC